MLLDNRPSFGVGKPRDGDYMAKGQGTCNVRGTPTRWAYFVAAPGFGPVRRMGIPVLGPLRGGGGDAGLPAGAESILPHLIRHTSFGDASVPDMVAAAARAGMR